MPTELTLLMGPYLATLAHFDVIFNVFLVKKQRISFGKHNIKNIIFYNPYYLIITYTPSPPPFCPCILVILRYLLLTCQIVPYYLLTYSCELASSQHTILLKRNGRKCVFSINININSVQVFNINLFSLKINLLKGI